MKKLQLVLLIFSLIVLVFGAIVLQTDKAFASPRCCETVDCGADWTCADQCRQGDPPYCLGSYVYIIGPGDGCPNNFPYFCAW